MIKATEGLTYVNPALKSEYAKAKALGMKVGFYHYIRANDTIAEAEHFLSTISGLTSDCLYGIDAEHTEGTNEDTGISARTRKFADYLIANKKSPVLYTNLGYYQTQILPICYDLPLWVAKVGGTRPSIKSVGWQYSFTPIDQDIFDTGILLPTSKPAVAAVKTTIISKPVVKYPITLTVTATVLNIRAIAGINGRLLGQLRKGSKIKVAGLSNGWYNVYYGTHGGFCSSQYLK